MNIVLYVNYNSVKKKRGRQCHLMAIYSQLYTPEYTQIDHVAHFLKTLQ